MLCIPDSCPARHSRDEELYTSLQHNRSTTKVQSERHRTAEAYAPCGAEWKQKSSAVAGCELLIKYHRFTERVVPGLKLVGRKGPLGARPYNRSRNRAPHALAVPGHTGAPCKLGAAILVVSQIRISEHYRNSFSFPPIKTHCDYKLARVCAKSSQGVISGSFVAISQ